MDALAIPLLLLVGGLLALQAGANVQLSSAMRSPFGASTLQLGIAAALLLGVVAVVGTLGPFAELADVEVWHLIGGPGSAIYITAGILLFPRLGAVVTVGLFIAGQMAASLLIDGIGLLGVERQAPGVAASAGAVAVLLGAWLIAGSRVRGATEEAVRGRGRWVALGLAGGAALPVQGAINAQLRADLDAPAAVGAISFIAATAFMAIVLMLAQLVAGAPAPRVAPLGRVPWWGWLGGLCGATYVVAVFELIPEIGASAVVALTVAGQQVVSLLLDRYGLLRLPRRPISRRRLLGVGALLAGMALIQVG